MNRRAVRPQVLVLAVALASGCFSEPAPDDDAAPSAPSDVIELSGCAIYQGIFAVNAAAAQALTPDPFVVQGFPGQDNPPVRDPNHAEMDTAFLRCDRALVGGEALLDLTYFALAFIVDVPATWDDGNVDLRYFARGSAASPVEFADILGSWGHGPVSAARVEHETGSMTAASRVVDATLAYPEGSFRMRATMATAEPLDRPSEWFRFFFVADGVPAAMDVVVGPHLASLGRAELFIDGELPWMEGTPEPELVGAAAHAGPPSTQWDIRLSRVALA